MICESDLSRYRPLLQQHMSRYDTQFIGVPQYLGWCCTGLGQWLCGFGEWSLRQEYSQLMVGLMRDAGLYNHRDIVDQTKATEEIVTILHQGGMSLYRQLMDHWPDYPFPTHFEYRCHPGDFIQLTLIVAPESL